MAYRVLIVEDQDIPRELFEIYINTSEDFEHLLSISNASAAVSVCRSSKVDLILMDVMTELERSGLDAAEEIKRVRPDSVGTRNFSRCPGQDGSLRFTATRPSASALIFTGSA